MEILEPNHDLGLIAEVASRREPSEREKQEAHLMKIDTWLEILFPQMEADYKEMHRMPDINRTKSSY